MPSIQARFQSRDGQTYGLEVWGIWGAVVVPTDNPDGRVVTENDLEGVTPLEDWPRISGREANAFTQLCIDMMGDEKLGPLLKLEAGSKVDTGLEVGVGAFFDTADPERGIFFIACNQEIGKAKVEADWTKPCVELVTGKTWTSSSEMPDTYVFMGDVHSHNDMGTYFSSTDDKDDKDIPGLHLVFGDFKQKEGTWTFNIATSIVLGGQRYSHVREGDKHRPMVWSDLIDDTDDPYEYHQDVFNVITIEDYSVKRKPKASSSYDGWGAYSPYNRQEYDEEFICPECTGTVTGMWEIFSCDDCGIYIDEVEVCQLETAVQLEGGLTDDDVQRPPASQLVMAWEMREKEKRDIWELMGAKGVKLTDLNKRRNWYSDLIRGLQQLRDNGQLKTTQDVRMIDVILNRFGLNVLTNEELIVIADSEPADKGD